MVEAHYQVAGKPSNLKGPGTREKGNVSVAQFNEDRCSQLELMGELPALEIGAS
jgi:hypothetical protein